MNVIEATEKLLRTQEAEINALYGMQICSLPTFKGKRLTLKLLESPEFANLRVKNRIVRFDDQGLSLAEVVKQTLHIVFSKLPDANLYQLAKDSGVAHSTLRSMRDNKSAASYPIAVKLIPFLTSERGRHYGFELKPLKSAAGEV